MVLNTGTKWHAKLQSYFHHQWTNTQLFTDWMPFCRPTNSVRALKWDIYSPCSFRCTWPTVKSTEDVGRNIPDCVHCLLVSCYNCSVFNLIYFYDCCIACVACLFTVYIAFQANTQRYSDRIYYFCHWDYVCLSCLSVHSLDNSKSHGQILMKFFGMVGCMTKGKS